MKSKIVSLSKNSEFLSLLNGKKIANKYSTIFFKKLKNKNYKCLNVSFVAKKKIGNAVIRNKIKRRLKNIMNGIIKEKQVSFDYCYLFLAKKNVFDDDFKKIKGILAADLKKIKT
tara:strand:- start:295 stop:639 length:345 start_codon:yes stop_codon:yes gene_type:complete